MIYPDENFSILFTKSCFENIPLNSFACAGSFRNHKLNLFKEFLHD